MYTKVDVAKPGDNKGVGGNKKGEITLFDWDDAIGGYQRDANGIIMPNTLVLKENAYMVKIYATQSTIKITRDAEGDPDAKGVIQGLEFSHPGSSVEITAAEQYWMNRNIGAIVDSCDGSSTKLLGTPCAPLQLVFKGEDDKDKNTSIWTLKSTQKGPNIAEYQGTKTLATVTGTIAADATDIDLTNGGGQYQSTDGTTDSVTLATMSNPVDGLVFTILGASGSNPLTIAANTVFAMHNGSQWSGIAGAKITFKVFKDGASTYKAIEQSRS